MERIIEEYIQTLIKENDLLDKLLELGEEKKQIIILGKIQELDKLIQKESITASNLERTENARFKLHVQIAQRWEMPAEELTAGTLIEKSQASQPLFTDQLKQEIEHMGTTINRLREINRENNELIGMSLEYIDNMQSILIGDLAGTYSEKGTQASENNSRPAFKILDKKA